MMIYLLVFMFVLAMQNKYLPTLASSEHLKPHIGHCFVWNESFLFSPSLELRLCSPSWEMCVMWHKLHILWSHILICVLSPLSPLPSSRMSPGNTDIQWGHKSSLSWRVGRVGNQGNYYDLGSHKHQNYHL